MTDHLELHGVDLWQVRLPLVTPFRTSQYAATTNTILILRLDTSLGPGWAECSTDDLPVYSGEYLGTARTVLQDVLIPTLLERERLTPAVTQEVLARFKGHKAAKSALEMGVLDAWLRSSRMSLSAYLGGVRSHVQVGVSVGIPDSIAELLDLVAGYLDQGYGRVKLKIQPGFDIEPVRAVRREFGDELTLQVDANASYSPHDARHLKLLDAYALDMLEQPLAHDDLLGHARLAQFLETPLCLDESIPSPEAAAAALELQACRIVNIKPARVGGYLSSRRIHDLCASSRTPVWCGGMLECGIGRAANLALASLPNFTLHNDISETRRYYSTDITAPFCLQDGTIPVPSGPGLGVDVDVEALEDLAVDHALIGHR